MVLRLACPLCRTDVVMDEAFAGKEVLCPKCGGRFTAPSVTAAPTATHFAPVPSDLEPAHEPSSLDALPRYHDREDSFRLPSMMSGERRWRATLTGLNLMFWPLAISTALLVPLGVLVAIMQTLTGNVPGRPQPAIVLMALGISGMVCMVLILLIIYFVGLCMCCAAPSESRAKGKAIGTVCVAVTMAGYLLIVMIYAFVKAVEMERVAPGRPPIGPEALGYITLGFVLLYSAYLALLMLFLRAVAQYFHNGRLARNSIWYLFGALSFLAIGGLIQLAISDRPPNDPAQGGALAVGLIGNVALLVWFLVILRRTRNTIVDGAPRLDEMLFEA
jgi:hypothetical protein